MGRSRAGTASTRERLSALLAKSSAWLTSSQIAARLGADTHYISEELGRLKRAGIVEKRHAALEQNVCEWRGIKPAPSTTTAATVRP